MADNPANDPFTRAYDAIIAACRAHAPLMALVRPGNLIVQRGIPSEKFREKIVDKRMGDWPDEMLQWTGFNFDGFDCSSLNVHFNASYAMHVHSGAITMEVASRVCFETSRALFASGPYLGINDLIQKWSCTRASSVNYKAYAGTNQWVAVLNINVMMSMSKQRLSSYPSQTFNQ